MLDLCTSDNLHPWNIFRNNVFLVYLGDEVINHAELFLDRFARVTWAMCQTVSFQWSTVRGYYNVVVRAII